MSDVDASVRALCERGEYDEATVLVLKAWGGAIYRFIAARVRDEDLTSDAFAKFSEDLWRGMAKFEGRAPVKVWSYAIARNAAEIRTDTREYLRTGFKTRFRELARRLAPEEHAIMWLRINERMSWEEIARVQSDVHGPELKREAARLRKRFQLVREKLRTMAESEGLVPDKESKLHG
jgi:RNA polymerase sigma-70 factor (ECF subfamily)